MCIHPIRLHAIRCGWGVWPGCVVGPNTMSASSYLHSPNKAARNGVWLGCVAGVWLGQIQCQHPVTCIHTIMLHAMGCVVGVCCWCVAGVWLVCGWGVAGVWLGQTQCQHTATCIHPIWLHTIRCGWGVWLGCSWAKHIVSIQLLAFTP